MPTRLIRSWPTLLIAAMIAAGGSDGLCQTKIRLARIADVPDQIVGAELLTRVYARINVPVEFVDLPAKRALIESSEGHIDGEVQRVLDVENEYPSLVPVREPINYIEPSVFTKSVSMTVAGWNSIRDYNVGIVRGVGSSERGTKGMPRVYAVTTMEQLMKMLAAGHIDLAVNDRFSGLMVIHEAGLQGQIKALSPALEHIDLYHFLYKRNAALVPRLEAAIRAMRATGELEALRQKITDRLIGAETK